MDCKSIKGILWLFISKFFPPIINFSVFTYSARILAPEDFGLVALALSIILIVSSFMPVGWREAIIKYQISDNEVISSIFWFNFMTSVILSFVIFAFVLLDFFDFQTEVFNYTLIIFTIKLIFDGLFGTLNLILLKEEKYTLLALRTIFSAIISAIIIVLLLHLEFGIWALVWSQVLLSFTNFVAVYIPTREVIKLKFSVTHITKIKEFSGYTTLTNGLTAGLNHYESVVIGAILGNRELGLYSIAKRLATVINDICVGTLSEVSFPILAKQQHEMSKLRVAFLNSVYLSVVLLYPIFIFCFITSEELFYLLFTEKWLDSVGVFQAFCIMFMIVILGIPQKNIILITNNARWWFNLQVKLSCLIVPITTISAFWGVSALLISLACGKAIYCGCSMWRSCRLLSIPVKGYILSFIRPVICGVVCAFIVVYIKQFMMEVDLLLLNIFISGILFVSLYLVLLLVLDGKKLSESCLVLFPKNQYVIKFNHKFGN